jgi:hypothetical protein
MSQIQRIQNPKLLPDLKLPANRPQLRAMLAMGYKRVYKLIWGRGTGKSFFIAWWMIQVSRRLPGSTWAFVTPTYTKLLTDILPGSVNALERLGYINESHFFVRKQPPKAWDWGKAYAPPLIWDYTLTIWHKERMSIFQFVSQDKDLGGRGRNYDGVIGDEGLQINLAKLEKNVLATNRGNGDHFKNPLHHAVLLCSSMPYTQSGMWMLDNIDQPDVYYSEADAFENIDYGVDIRYIKDQQQMMTPTTFRIEMLNERIRKVQDGFYSGFDTLKHCYDPKFHYNHLEIDYDMKQRLMLDCRVDDYDIDKPLDMGLDWGGQINTGVIAQTRLIKREQLLVAEERIINAMYVKSPDILDHLAHKFIAYYRFHKNKTLNLYYDVSGNTKWGNSQLTMAQQFSKILVTAGWRVIPKTVSGRNASHDDKYLLINRILRNTADEIHDPKLPLIQINKDSCKELIISMQQAPAKQGRQGMQKDKSSERKKDFPQEEATHFSDAFDMLIWGKYRMNMKSSGGSFAPNLVISI